MRISIFLASAALTAIAAPAYAQDADSDTPTDLAENAAVDDGNIIIVTAQGRAQRLQDVPIAVNAVSAESMQNSGANDIRQLNQLAPSLLVSSTGTEANGSARIRGIGTVGDNPGLESSVAVFIDGVYRSRTGVGLNELGEIDRIEVLRGPQGTLFGRNASAGLINIVSRAPSFQEEGNAEASYGNYDYYRLAMGLTGPIGNSGFAYRLDGVYVHRDGFYDDISNNNVSINNRDRYFIRGQLLYEASPDLTFRLIGDYTHRDERCCAAVYATTDLAPANAGLLEPSNPIIPVLTSLGLVIPSIDDVYERQISSTPGRVYDGTTEDYGVSLQADWDLGGAELTSITAYREYDSSQAGDIDYGTVDILYRDPADEGFRRFHTFSQELRLQGEAFGGVLDWLVGAYYANEDLALQDNLRFGDDFGPFMACRLLATINPGIPRAPSAPGCLVPSSMALPGGTAAILQGIFPDPDGAGPIMGAQPFIDGLTLLSQVRNAGAAGTNFRQNSENFAFFTHNIVHLTDTVDLTLGLRYTNETKTLDASFNNDNTVCPLIQGLVLPYVSGAATTTVPISLIGGLPALGCLFNYTSELNGQTLTDRRSEGEFTGTAVLSWRPTPDILVYGSYSHGYKAGGFNLDTSALKSPVLPFAAVGGVQSLAANLQFDAEQVDAFEIGFKYTLPGFSLAVAAFRQQFSNFQLNTFNGSFFVVQNINGCSTDLGGADRDASATTGACAPDDVTYGVVSQGVEIEATLIPADYLRVGLGLTYADTHYRNNLVGTDDGSPLVPPLALIPGDNLSNAPEIVATGSLAWTPPIGNSGLSGLFYVDARLTGDFNTGSDLFPQKEQDGFVVVNGRIGIRGPDDLWALEIWAQNLFDQDYTQVAFSSPLQAPNQIFSAFLAEPRTFGVTVRTRF